jgi:hypothetical protein
MALFGGSRLPLAAAAVLTLAIAVCAQSVSPAGCGDYVTLGPDRAPHGRPAMPLPGAHPLHNPMNPHGQPVPCQGPMCSRGPMPAPLPAPAPNIPTGEENSGLFVPRLLLAESQAVSGLADSCLLHVILRPSDIFHPPRQSAV